MNTHWTIACVIAATAACGVEPPCPAADLAPLERTPAWAVVTSDYESTAVALLDAEGEPITEAWIDSGSVEPGIATALSGDVALPTDPVPGELVLLDRFGVDVVTRIALPGGEVLAQLPTQLSRDDSPSGFRANPHDVVFLDDGRALVSRFEPNPNSSAPPLDRGNDIVVVDTATAELVDRIDLSSADVPRDDEDDPVHWARPSRMTAVGDRVAVGLGRLSTHWVAAGGAIALVDPTTSPAGVTIVDIDGLAGCEQVRADPAGAPRALVLCYGDPFEPGTLDAASTERRRERAGLASVVFGADGTAEVEHLWRAADGDGPVPSGSLAALGDTRIAFVAMGDRRDERPDRVYVMDLAVGDPRAVLESDPFAVGPGAFDTDTGSLLLPDASRGVLRVRVREDLTAERLPAASASPCRGLPAREVAPLVAP